MIFRAAEKEGIWAWDCVENKPVLVLPIVLALLGDNPQSEFACHIGLWGKLFYQICKVIGKDMSDTPRGAALGNVDEGKEVEDDASINSNVSGASNVSANPEKKGKRKKFVESLEQMVRCVTAFIKVDSLFFMFMYSYLPLSISRAPHIYAKALWTLSRLSLPHSKQLRTRYGSRRCGLIRVLRIPSSYISRIYSPLRTRKSEAMKAVKRLWMQLLKHFLSMSPVLSGVSKVISHIL